MQNISFIHSVIHLSAFMSSCNEPCPQCKSYVDEQLRVIRALCGICTKCNVRRLEVTMSGARICHACDRISSLPCNARLSISVENDDSADDGPTTWIFDADA